MRMFRAAVCIVVFAGIAAVAACGRAPDKARHTVTEYRANATLRHEEIERCANDPGTLGKTPDCVNAREASRIEDIKSLREMPPVRLPDNGKPYAKDTLGH
jgi:hypothetical protein